MAISYEGLWNILNEKGISKTEFRKLVNISTVTLAKMSKNEPVSMSVIESICLTLRCRIEEVMKIEIENKEGKWERIREDAVYLIRLFYLTCGSGPEESVDFLYGYSIMADEGMESRRYWELSEQMKRENIRVWEITSAVSGDILWTLIRAMEQNKSLGDFLEECSAELHDDLKGEKKKYWRGIFLNARISHPKKDYRPEIVLIPERESGLWIKGMQPLHAFGEEPLICESLVCGEKRKIYCEENDVYDTDKMELVYDFFQKEKFLINGIKDLCRIGDFEVFSALVDNAGQKELFRIESQVEKPDNIHRILKGFTITVFSGHLSGSYLLGVITYNAGNPTSWKIYDIVVDGQDVARTVNFAESSAGAVVCIWEKTEEKRIQLIGYKQISVVRDMVINMRMDEGIATIEDKYTEKFRKTYGEKNKDAVNRTMKRYSSMETRMEDKGNDPWRKEFDRVERDFGELYGTEMAESRFFARGMLAHEEFLEWLKKEINREKIRNIWIFDPYIDADSVTRILRSLSDLGVKMNIVTDANAHSRNQDNRIDMLQNACGQLGEFLENRFAFYALDKKKNECLLHDRMLLLFGQKYIPVVYNMSNSLDNMGMHTPSVVCRLDRSSAKEAAEYYLGLYQKERDEGEVQVLWEKENGSRKGNMVMPSEEEQEKYLADLTEFFNEKLKKEKLPVLYRKKGRIAFPDVSEKEEKARILEVLCADADDYWEKICYLCANMEYPDHTDLKESLEDHYNRQWGRKLQEALMEELNNEEDSKGQQKGVLRVYRKDDFGAVLQNMGYLLENPFDVRTDNRLSLPGRMALETLIARDLARYQEVLGQLEEKEGSWQALKWKKELIRRLACIMEERKELSGKLAEKCLESECRDLVAIGMQWFIKCRKVEPAVEKVKDPSYCHEFFKRMVIDLQVEDCRRGYRAAGDGRADDAAYEEKKNGFLAKMQEVKEAWVNYFSDALTADRLEKEAYFKEIGTRSKEDVRDLAVMLWEAGKLSVTELERFLTGCFLEKLEEDYQKEDGYWRMEDFQNGELFLKALKGSGTEEAGREVVQKLVFWEKRLVRILHDVFLQRKNYTKWKCCIDMLMWCRTMSAVCQSLWEGYETWEKEDRNRQARDKEIQGLMKKYHAVLKEHSDAYRILCSVRKDFGGGMR